jgi:K+-transporting ATPase A subunit
MLALAFNVAISFTANISPQLYRGEIDTGSWEVGTRPLASRRGRGGAVALIRPLIATQKSQLGNFWVDEVANAHLGLPPPVGRNGSRQSPLSHNDFRCPHR